MFKIAKRNTVNFHSLIPRVASYILVFLFWKHLAEKFSHWGLISHLYSLVQIFENMGIFLLSHNAIITINKGNIFSLNIISYPIYNQIYLIVSKNIYFYSWFTQIQAPKYPILPAITMLHKSFIIYSSNSSPIFTLR